MHRFLNILTDDSTLVDPDGQVFSSVGSALEEAELIARELIAEELLAGRPLPYRWAVQIVDHRGAAEATLSFAEVMLGMSNGSRTATELLAERETWLLAQKQAFEASVSGACLDTTLAFLVKAVVAILGDGARAAFYLANQPASQTNLRRRCITSWACLLITLKPWMGSKLEATPWHVGLLHTRGGRC